MLFNNSKVEVGKLKSSWLCNIWDSMTSSQYKNFSKAQSYCKNISQPRYERKYLVPHHCPKSIERLIKLHPYFFQEIYYPRVINNVYFDDRSLQNYFDNINGYGYRTKMRLRWYSRDYMNLGLSNDSKCSQNLQAQPQLNKKCKKSNNSSKKVSSPHLEMKIRSGDLIRKQIFSSLSVVDHITEIIPPSITPLFNIKPCLNSQGTGADSIPSNSTTCDNNSLFKDNNFNYQNVALLKLKQYLPIIFNTYQRQYFLSSHKKVRITIDSDIRFHEIVGQKINWNRYWQLPVTIMEIKADYHYDREIAESAKYFPLPVTKSSKYVLGVMSCKSEIESPLYNLPVRPRQVSTV